MRISNQQLFDQAVDQMARQQTTIADLQAQIGAGKQLIRPSDNSDKSAVIQRLNTALSQQEVYDSTLNSLSNRLDIEESVVLSSVDILQRIKELAVLSNDGANTEFDLSAIAAEVEALREELFAQSNQQDANGNYIFSGSDVKSPAFTQDNSGFVTYTGNQQHITVDISKHRYIDVNRPGSDVFTSVDREGINIGFFQVLDDFVTALNGADSAGIGQALSEIGTLTDDITGAISNVGARMGIVESHRATLAEVKLRYEMLLSAEETLDYTVAITELSAQILSLEGAQASFVKISQLSLFNYIK
jgi:flagellar hook-associated protein 3 FlgL